MLMIRLLNSAFGIVYTSYLTFWSLGKLVSSHVSVPLSICSSVCTSVHQNCLCPLCIFHNTSQTHFISERPRGYCHHPKGRPGWRIGPSIHLILIHNADHGAAVKRGQINFLAVGAGMWDMIRILIGSLVWPSPLTSTHNSNVTVTT